MERIEKTGAFYLGREYDAKQGETLPREISFDARDLTTHAVCLGMTGSGKTGLCIDDPGRIRPQGLGNLA